MTYDNFFNLIQAMRKLSTHADTVRRFGVDLGGINDKFHAVIRPLLETVFTEYQIHTLEWWLYDAPNAIHGTPTQSGYIEDSRTGVITPLQTEREFYDYLMTLKGPTQ